MERGKMSSAGRGAKSKVPQHPADIFALGSKSTVVVNRDAEKRNIHKPSTSSVERKREPSGFGNPPPNKRSRIGSPAEAVGGTSLEVDPVDLVPNVLQALDTHNSDKLLGLLTGSIRLLKSQRSKPDPILCMSMLYLTKIRPNMFAHETVTQSLCTLLKREQGAAFKSKGNPLVFVLACNMLYAGHRDSKNWPDTFIKVYMEDALNERWWVECSWCKCLVENIVTAFSTKHPPPHLIPSENTLGTMSPSGSGSPLMGSTEDDTDNTDLEYTVFPRYSSSYETVEALVLEAIKEQIQRRAAPDAIHKGFLKLLSATCGFPEIRMIAASRLEAWLHSGKLWRCAQELLAFVCCNADACGPTAQRDHEVLAQLARMRLKTKALQAAYQACLREMVTDSPALLRSVVTHTIYNELSNVRSPNNMAVLAALVQAQPQLVPAAMADTYHELLIRSEDYLRPLRALTRECVRAARAEAGAAGGAAGGAGGAAGALALAALARALAAPPPHEPAPELRDRAFAAIADLFCCFCMLTAQHSKHLPDYRHQITMIQCSALGWLLETAVPMYRPSQHDFRHALNKIMFVEPAETYSKVDNWPPESERALTYRLCCEAPLPQNNLLRVIFIGLAKDMPVSPAETFELVEQLVRRACALPPEDCPLQLDKLEVADYIFQLCQFNPPDNISLPPGYTPPQLAITSLYWRGWLLLAMLAAHNPDTFAGPAARAYPTLRALIETCITNKPSIEWNTSASAGTEAERAEAERAAILQLESHLAAASNAKLPVTEHTSRLLSQLTILDPLGPARKPPQSVVETLQALSSQMRLGKLLCRQPALLLELVERHGTRRAMPWLHQLLRHDRLELSVLPVQCLCEFLSAGVGGEAGKAGQLCAHLRRSVAGGEAGARAVLHYYLQRLAHAHAATRAAANRGLKLVLTQSGDEATEMDYNADVSPGEWLELVWHLRHWPAVRSEVVARVRAACLVECVPGHVADYLQFLAKHVASTPQHDHTDLALDLSQVLMERTTVIGSVLPPAELRDPPPPAAPRPHRTLHALTLILYTHLRQQMQSSIESPDSEAAPWSPTETVSLQWASGRRATLHVNIAQAHLKLLCYGPSIYDTNQEMYTWLQNAWVGADAPIATVGGVGGDAADNALLPDWLRLHLVRSARPPLLEAGLRSLPANKLALFIQTFGMPVTSMSALLAALDACPAGAVVRLGVERGYMAQLLRVQRARGAAGGRAFAAALQLPARADLPDENLFAPTPLPKETVSPWSSGPRAPEPLPLEMIPAVLSDSTGELHAAATQLLQLVTSEAKRAKANGGALPPGGAPYSEAVVAHLRLAAASGAGVAALAARQQRAATLLRALAPAHAEVASALLSQMKCVTGPLANVLVLSQRTQQRHLPERPLQQYTRDQLIAVFESATPSSLESIGNKIIETQPTQLVVDVISQLLENNQKGLYETQVKTEDGDAQPGLFSRGGLGCGLLLDWLAELQREIIGPEPQRQMRLMFVPGCAAWRPLLVTLLAHRASWRTLHAALAALLAPGEWAASSVLDFAETLVGSERVWQGRDKATPKHYTAEDTLHMTHHQLDVLIRYVVAEAEEAERAGGPEAMRRRIESRLPLILRCCGTPHALLACALAAAREHPMLLLLLYMKVPKILQLLRSCSERPSRRPTVCSSPALQAAHAHSTSATDRVSHSLLTALATAAHAKENSLKLQRMEAGIRSVWSRMERAGTRALPLAGALLRGSLLQHQRHHLHILAAIEVLPDEELFSDNVSSEVHNIVECFLGMLKQQGGRESSRDNALQYRVAALLRRYLTTRPQRATQLLHAHRDTLASIPALSSLSNAELSAPASSLPPPHALRALQRRQDPPEELLAMIQELESWGGRRGGAWGGAGVAGAVLRAAAPLCAAPHAPLRAAALALLARLLPAVPDTAPGLNAVLECLESNQPEICQSALDKLPELVIGMQEHAARLLLAAFELGAAGRHPVETCLAKCVATINLHRGC
ncbi:integrator complex subunit 1 [Amyelois transitella]|uniref:integrator complex subunit 1 n=1 Tax=Amyelois transitella TaxID=680683 RepID=UPI00298FBB0A|nr:integrator complex subunit 1 [Amyelois transitella]